MRDLLGDKLHDECGVFGIFSRSRDVVQSTYWGLYALQHRGQDSAGICVSDGEEMLIHKEKGLVCDIFKHGFGDLTGGHLAIGHVRYPSGGAATVTSVEPLKGYYDGGDLAIAHNGSLNNSKILRKELLEKGMLFQTDAAVEPVLGLIVHGEGETIEERVAKAADRLEGAFAMVVMTDRKLMAFRDPYGFRPLCLGRLADKGGWVVASETCALDQVDAEYVRDLEPGELIVIDSDKRKPKSIKYSTHMPAHCAHCVFEYVYFARPDSIMDGQSIYMARFNMGRQLARETKNIKADIAISVPDSGTPAAIGYAYEAGIPFMEGLIRNKYIGRTFIQPTQQERLDMVKIKLNANKGLLKGKKVVMVDDSIVRGTTSAKLVALVKEAGATEVHVCISSPPVICPCFYGVDTPDKDMLIAAHKTPEQIRKLIKADSLHYITPEGMKEALTELRPEDMCYACFDTVYPDGADKLIAEVRAMKDKAKE